MKVLLSKEDLHDGVTRMAEEIAARYADRQLTIVGVLTGSVVLMADLIRLLELPMRVGVLQASSYRGATTTRGELVINSELMLGQLGDHFDQCVTGVEDVVDHQHVAALEIREQLVVDHQGGTALRLAAELLSADERHAQGVVELADQVGEHHQAAGQHADDRQRPLVVLSAKLLGKPLNAGSDFLLAQQRLHGGYAGKSNKCSMDVVRFEM